MFESNSGFALKVNTKQSKKFPEDASIEAFIETKREAQRLLFCYWHLVTSWSWQSVAKLFHVLYG